MSTENLPKWLLPSIAVTAILCAVSIYKRSGVEASNKATSLAVEYETVQALASADGMQVPQALTILKAQGVNAVVLSEDTVSEMIYEGRATAQGMAIHTTDHDAASRIIRGLRIRFRGVDPDIVADPKGGGSTISMGAVPMLLMRPTAIGIDPAQAAIVKEAKMTVVARCSNSPGVTPEYVTQTIRWARSLGATVFLPQGDQVLGRRESIQSLIDAMNENSGIDGKPMLYASPEFAKMGGDEEVVRKAKELVIRLHSAQSAELDKLPYADAVDRYVRASRERNMRMLLIRPVTYASQKPLSDFALFVRDIDRHIIKEGNAIGTAKPFREPFHNTRLQQILFLLIALSVIPTGYYVGSMIFQDRLVRAGGLALLSLLALSTLIHTGLLLMAFAASIIFPIAAFMILSQRRGANLLLEFLIVSFVSFVGGLVVAGLLNGLSFYIRADQFPGVKVAVFLPIAAVAAYFFWKLGDFKETMRNPITWSSALLALVMLGALAFMISRTGNDNPAGVSDTELKFRNALDALLVVRPRTKEFLIGHPLMILGIGLLLWQRRTGIRKFGGWIALALAGGAIGQTDVVNTMCHLHTTVTLSLLRIGVGLVAGCIIGLVLWAVVKRLLPQGEGV